MAPGLFKGLCGYDAGSNRKTLTDPSNGQTTYTYDTLNRLTNILDFNNNNFGFGYDGLSRRTQLTRANGVNTNYAYDTVSNLLSILHQQGASTLDGATYTYDSAGNRKSKNNLLNSATSNFSYDNLYQLTGVTGTNPESYTYDPVGNRLSSQTIANYSYNSSNELASSSAASYTYDNNGNTLSKTVSASTTQYTWDFENRLISVQPATGGTVSFKYDPFGRRIQKAGASTTNYVYDGANVIEEVDSSENLLAKYSQGVGIDEPLSELRSAAVSYYEQDGLGSVTSLSNIGGALANTYIYDSFGNLTSSSGTVTNPYQYTGRDYDPETGLRYYRARYYDNSAGRFVTEDSMRFGSGGVNFYLYVENSPIRFNDPSGNEAQCCDKNIQQGRNELQKLLNGTAIFAHAVTKKYKNCLLKFPEIKIKCDPTIQGCGKHRAFGVSTIVISPRGSLGRRGDCGPVASTLLHEFIHICYQNDVSAPNLSPEAQEKEAFQAECDVFGTACVCARNPKKCGYQF